MNYIKYFEDFVSDRAVAPNPDISDTTSDKGVDSDINPVVHIKNWNQY